MSVDTPEDNMCLERHEHNNQLIQAESALSYC